MTARETLDGGETTEATPAVVPSPGAAAAGQDRGLAKERTRMAWNRTGLSLLAMGAAILRAVTESTTLVKVVTAVVVLGALTIAGAVPVATRRATGGSVQPVARPPAAMGLIAVSTAVMTAAAIVLTLFPAGR